MSSRNLQRPAAHFPAIWREWKSHLSLVLKCVSSPVWQSCPPFSFISEVFFSFRVKKLIDSPHAWHRTRLRRRRRSGMCCCSLCLPLLLETRVYFLLQNLQWQQQCLFVLNRTRRRKMISHWRVKNVCLLLFCISPSADDTFLLSPLTLMAEI